MDDHERELYELDPTGRFSDRAADYVRYRPGYPPDAFAAILAGLGEPARLVVADVGAGTGISARSLASRVGQVIAVEPNAAMRGAATPDPRIRWVAGTAEETGLAGAAVDLVLCAQAFHWFRPGPALAEFHRVLRPGGRLALMWNARDRSDALTLGYAEAIRAVAGEHPAEIREFDPAVIETGGWFAPARSAAWANAQALDRAGLVGRALSASYVPREGARRADLVARLEALVDEHRDAAGLVRLRYETRLYLSESR
jgi:SAM-dependent methyltransferase